jgi:hypothetical protein
MPADTAEIGLFNNFQAGSVYFDNPKMTVTLSNSYGMPVDAQLNSLYAILKNGNQMPIIGPIPSPLINYPFSLGQTVTNSFVFDKNNSNIELVINAIPKNIVYEVSAGTNSPLPTYNFMSDSSVFRADLRIDFPLKGYATGFEVQDTVDFSIGNIDVIKSAAFRLNVSNGFPISAYTQLYFTDENYVILDSLLTEAQDRIIEAGEVDANGRVIKSTERSADELFEGAHLQNLMNAKKIIIKGIIQTKDAPTTMVEIFDNYELDFKLGVRTKLKIEM